jgi:hypothetical protein
MLLVTEPLGGMAGAWATAAPSYRRAGPPPMPEPQNRSPTKKAIKVLKIGTDCPSKNLGTCCHKMSGDVSCGCLVQGTYCHGDASLQKSRERIVTGMHRSGTDRHCTLIKNSYAQRGVEII